MAIDGAALAKALGTDVEGAATVHSLLCRREAPAFQRAARSADDLLVACTQESRLFVELAAATEGAPSPTERTHARARALLERHGVVARETVRYEAIDGGFAAVPQDF